MKVELFSGTGCRVTTEDGTDLISWLQSQGIFMEGLHMSCIPGDVHSVRLNLICYSTTVVIPEDMVTLRRMKFAETIELEK